MITAKTETEHTLDEKDRLTRIVRGRRHWVYRCILQTEDGNTIQTDYEAPWIPDKDFVTPESCGNACAATVTVAQKAKHVCLTAFIVTKELLDAAKEAAEAGPEPEAA